MSTLQNDMIFESINDNWDIRPCFNGVGMWEVFNHDMGDMHEIYDTLDEARKAREELVLDQWEDMLQ